MSAGAGDYRHREPVAPGSTVLQLLWSDPEGTGENVSANRSNVEHLLLQLNCYGEPYASAIEVAIDLRAVSVKVVGKPTITPNIV